MAYRCYSKFSAFYFLLHVRFKCIYAWELASSSSSLPKFVHLPISRDVYLPSLRSMYTTSTIRFIWNFVTRRYLLVLRLNWLEPLHFLILLVILERSFLYKTDLFVSALSILTLRWPSLGHFHTPCTVYGCTVQVCFWHFYYT